MLDIAETWLAWDGRPVFGDGNAWTPHKALPRVTDHLVDHLAEIECRLAGVPSLPDRWHGRRLTLDSDWARFTEADLDEATSRLTRLAACYQARVGALDDAALDAVPEPGVWTIRQVVHTSPTCASTPHRWAGSAVTSPRRSSLVQQAEDRQGLASAAVEHDVVPHSA